MAALAGGPVQSVCGLTLGTGLDSGPPTASPFGEMIAMNCSRELAVYLTNAKLNVLLT